MDSTTSIATLVIIAGLALLAIYIQVLIIRWVFKIEQQLSNQRATVWLLMKLCEKQGVAPEEIMTIKASNNIK